MRLTEPDCRARFAGARVARLATLAEDGSPRLVPVTFALAADPGRGDVIFSAVDHKPKSTAELARLRRIERDPRVSLLADDYTEDWARLWWVRADARGEVLTAGTEWEAGVTMLQEKYEQYRARRPRNSVLRFVVHAWSGWDGGAARTT